MLSRARIIPFTPKIYEKEITNLKEIFFLNGYSIKFVNDVIQGFPTRGARTPWGCEAAFQGV